MRAHDDKLTGDLLGDSCDMAGPVPQKPTAKEQGAARTKKYREKNGVRPVTINLPVDVADKFDAYMAKRPGTKKGDVIAKLLTSQLLRPR
ncbi:MAG: hypothetical protein ACXW2U_00835 [Telluria sp.]